MKLSRVSYMIGFGDCGMPGINKVASLLLSHRRCEEIESGLKPIFSCKKEIVHFLRGRWSKSHPVSHEDRYLRELEDQQPRFDF
jgi:hypothetical protein